MNKKKQRKRERRVLDAARELALTMRMGLYTGDEITILTERATANPETCESEAFLKFFEALDGLEDKRYSKLLRNWATDGEVDPDWIVPPPESDDLQFRPRMTPRDGDFTVETLAEELGISRGSLRGFLRYHFPRPDDKKFTRWGTLTRKQVQAARKRFVFKERV